MNPVYLVEPSIIKSADDVIDLESLFGIPNTGRLFGFNPSDYIKQIHENISLNDISENTKQAYDDAISNLRCFSAKGSFSDAPGMNWDSSSNKALHDGLIDCCIPHRKYTNVRNLALELKKVDHRSINKRADHNYFIDELKNIFCYSAELKIIDPFYFDRDNRFRILSKLISNGSLTKKCKSIDIIVSMNKYYGEFKERSGECAKLFHKHFNEDHSYTKIRYIIINDQGRDNYLHERVLISKLGVITLDHGVATLNGNEKMECSSLNIYNDMWKKYRTIQDEFPGSIIVPLN